METITIADTQRQTTRLGFGCSGIVGGFERRRSLALLETAFDVGIRHFDVAPMYGFGTAEGVLGEFLKRHPGDVTVTTKFGLLPERRHPLIRLIYRMGRRVLRSTQKASSGLATATLPLRKLAFTGEQAAHSLTASLRQLGLEAVDLLLLHEAESGDLQDDSLLAFLHEQVMQGRIRAFGVGSASPLLPDLLTRKPEYCNVIQSDWSAVDAELQDKEHFRITHRALQGGWQTTVDEVLHSREKRVLWSETVGVDLGDRAIWPKLLLRAALAVNAGTMVLFSTRSPSRILQNVAAAQDTTLAIPSIRLHKLLRAGSTHNLG